MQQEEENPKSWPPEQKVRSPSVVVVQGAKDCYSLVFETLSKVDGNLCASLDSNLLKPILEMAPLKQLFSDMEKRGARMRFITEITKENITYSKQLFEELGVELRHLDEVKGNFGLEKEKQYWAGSLVADETQEPTPEIIWSTAPSMVEQNEYVFNTLWSKAIPAEQRIAEIERGQEIERTEVIRGVEEVTRVGQRIVDNTRKMLSVSADQNAPALNFQNELYDKSYRSMKERGVHVQFVTEITKENLPFCKRMITEHGVDLRHTDDAIKGYFSVADGREFMASSTIDGSAPIVQILYSNSRDLADQYQSLFDSQWERAIPAEHRFRELEQGSEKYRTRVVHDPGENLNEVRRMMVSSEKRYCISGDSSDLIFAEKNLLEELKIIFRKFRAGQHEGLRWVGTIDESSIDVAKKFLEMGMNLRHIANVPVESFGFSDKEVGATVSKPEDGWVRYSTLFSNDPMYLEHYSSVFEAMWKNSSDARTRIREIEEGIQREFVNVIGNPAETKRVLLRMVDSAAREIMILFPTRNAYQREKKFGAIDVIEKKAESGVKVRIISPLEPEEIGMRVSSIQGLKADFPVPEISGTILIVDDKSSLAIELLDDSQNEFVDATGLSTYSTSEATVKIHRSFFQALWHESELKECAERSKREAELLQDILSHDIRNYNQAARLNAELLEEDVSSSTSKQLLNSLINSIDGSTALVDRAAEVGRILEVGGNVELFPVNLALTIEQALATVRKSQSTKDFYVKVEGIDTKDAILADEMLGEIFVNLFSNSARYTEGNKVAIETKVDCLGAFRRITIQDHGRGIPDEQKQGLFKRYVKNAHGSGLGLSIVHALVVDRYRGKITVKDRVYGDYAKGTLVELLLPVS